MRLLVAADQDKSNDKIQAAADNAVKLAQNAAAFRKAIERLDLKMLNQAYQDIADGNPDLYSLPIVPPELRKRTAAPEDEIQGNPLNCCK